MGETAVPEPEIFVVFDELPYHGIRATRPSIDAWVAAGSSRRNTKFRYGGLPRARQSAPVGNVTIENIDTSP
jgi:hypothetical protein